jgi:hypothetical protein
VLYLVKHKDNFTYTFKNMLVEILFGEQTDTQTYKNIFPYKKRKDDETTRDVWKVRGLVAVRRCYAEGGGDYYAKFQRWG